MPSPTWVSRTPSRRRRIWDSSRPPDSSNGPRDLIGAGPRVGPRSLRGPRPACPHRLCLGLGTWQGAGRGFRRAIELNPNLPDARVVYSQYLGILGLATMRALEQARLGAELDPLNFFFRQQYFVRLAWTGRFDEANSGLRDLAESGGDLPFIRGALWDNYFAAGEHDRGARGGPPILRAHGTARAPRLTRSRIRDAAGTRVLMKAAAGSLEEKSASSYVAAVDHRETPCPFRRPGPHPGLAGKGGGGTGNRARLRHGRPGVRELAWRTPVRGDSGTDRSVSRRVNLGNRYKALQRAPLGLSYNLARRNGAPWRESSISRRRNATI